jgi:hypothetical protein
MAFEDSVILSERSNYAGRLRRNELPARCDATCRKPRGGELDRSLFPWAPPQAVILQKEASHVLGKRNRMVFSTGSSAESEKS